MDMANDMVAPLLGPRPVKPQSHTGWLSRNNRDALAVLMALARHGGAVSIVISRTAQVPNTRFERVIRRLIAVGLVDARRGRTGGYSLARPPEQITMLDILGVSGEAQDEDLGLQRVGRQLRVLFERCTLADVLGPTA
jgi:Rrf2 family protein